MDGTERDLKALCELPRSTCPVPRCRANARPTGRLVVFADRWYMEHRCPDCDEVFTVWFPELDTLIALLDAAPLSEHDAIATAWVAGPQNPRFIRD
jgi:hypothetical protein